MTVKFVYIMLQPSKWPLFPLNVEIKRIIPSDYFIIILASYYCYGFLVPPRIVPFNFDEPIYSGQSAQITCLVSEGDTPLNISWWFRKSDKSELIPLPSGISVNKMGTKLSMLFIESTSSYFAGNYACVVENRAGSSKYTSTLNVHGKIMALMQCKLFDYAC